MDIIPGFSPQKLPVETNSHRSIRNADDLPHTDFVLSYDCEKSFPY